MYETNEKVFMFTAKRTRRSPRVLSYKEVSSGEDSPKRKEKTSGMEGKGKERGNYIITLKCRY